MNLKKYLRKKIKFDIRKLRKVDENAENIFKTHPPYYLFNTGDKDAVRDKVFFFNTDFDRRPFPENKQGCIETVNRCLDYTRREYPGYKLYYKSHPTAFGDEKLYNLDSFEIIKDRSVSEIFQYKNFNRIKHVFSIESTTTMIAYSIGLNSHVFYRLFREHFGKHGCAFYDSFLGAMPESFFISDLNQPVKENKIELKRDEAFEKHVAEQLNKNRGAVWFIIVDPGFLLIMISLSKLIKKLSPGRKVNLLITRHERWNAIDMNDPSIKENFDGYTFFPKVKYAIKLKNLTDAVKTVIAVKKFKIKSGDIICGMDMGSFLENCFVSYFKNNLSIEITTDQVFDFTHHFEDPPDLDDFKTKWSILFFTNIIEPLFGLYKGIRLYRPSQRNGGQFTRYRQALNNIFDFVYIFKYKQD
ncbi:MAG: hypothetical protein A3J47_03365 [Candidatus Yanofskybacteria bacterium RIFCSPHIGHO2_02_FULL_43_22]|uniref:Uncharacterized protein n=1 Tax=Candidatus Yanofskybacteria bacterium RIFCSPHIGHO2_02_FULL_43_22 TaxID=1802681 RepID=A0A1F8FR73_9BACT|nr:MAG: hypothetical protein A3J47_03365 [Candidatus Yanofskybacteria bacterium RIFCSPHIGHO2_02_FULL_43_22]